MLYARLRVAALSGILTFGIAVSGAETISREPSNSA